MAKIARATFTQFGLSGPTADFAQYGSQAASAPVKSKDVTVIQALTAWVNGWQDAVALGEAPYLEDMNGLLYVLSYMIAYQFQEGIAEWDSGTTYFIGSMVKKPGTFMVYGSLINTNLGNALPADQVSDSNWAFLYGISGSTFELDKSIAFADYSAQGINGTATNDSAPAGKVGQAVRNYASGVAAGLTTVFSNVTSISLTAGDWDVTGLLQLSNGGVSVSNGAGAISAFSGNTLTDQIVGDNELQSGSADAEYYTIANWRVSIASPTTIYLKARLNYSGGGSPTWAGRLSARRER